MSRKSPFSYGKCLEALLAASLFFLILHLITGYTLLLVLPMILMGGGLISTRATEWVGRFWLAAAHAIGAINNTVLLTIVFYLVLTPLAFAYRLVHRDLLQLKNNTYIDTYLISRNKSYISKDFEKLW
ncbi:SxtJ family membrane protein [Geobacter sp. DSM 9736]|uniref:SxtJ family membrane protein n=1 Tax=Geobacter sp. DSM 9736 TaxID=1277350 RepID=UPI000B50CD54|nr:SxtJ family membrane protein [Geobacter sp. DSM 9736]SNB46625.1 hypothetical protein SAMN06269301_2093 [Geobacter sp. DSM 9736]